MTTMAYYNKNVETNGTYVPVERYVDVYCKALTENYKQNTMRSYERYIMKRDSAEYYGGDNEAPHYGTFQQFLSDTKAGEEFLYCYPVKGGQKCSYTGGTIGWKAYSVTPIYDSNDNFINNDIQPVEIPDFDVADDS